MTLKGAKANFTWTANGGEVNFDTHRDGGSENVSYEKGHGVPDEGLMKNEIRRSIREPALGAFVSKDFLAEGVPLSIGECQAPSVMRLHVALPA